MPESKLKGCPFCGGPASLLEQTDQYGVPSGLWFARCDPCDLTPDQAWDVSREEAIAAWNTRAEAPTSADLLQVQELRGLLEVMQDGGRRLPWELWTSCSYRRIKTGATMGERDYGRDVLSGSQCDDGVVDLSMPEHQLFAMVGLLNALPRLLDIASRPQYDRGFREGVEP